MVILGDSSQCLVVEATDIAEYSKSEVLSIKHVPVPEGTRSTKRGLTPTTWEQQYADHQPRAIGSHMCAISLLPPFF